MGLKEPFFTSPMHGLFRRCSRSGLKRSHNVSTGTRISTEVYGPILWNRNNGPAKPNVNSARAIPLANIYKPIV